MVERSDSVTWTECQKCYNSHIQRHYELSSQLNRLDDAISAFRDELRKEMANIKLDLRSEIDRSISSHERYVDDLKSRVERESIKIDERFSQIETSQAADREKTNHTYFFAAGLLILFLIGFIVGEPGIIGLVL